METIELNSGQKTSLPGVLSALVPVFCLEGAPPWADMPLLQEPVWETAREAFCPVFSGSSGSPEETPFHLPPPSPWLSKSSSGFFSSSVLSQGSSVADRFSESVFSCEENRTEELCAEKSIKCELGPGMSFQIISLKKKKKSSSDLYFKRTPKMPLFLSLCSFKFH